jgi:hypothetical protein
MLNRQTARENPAAASNGGRHIPQIGDATRKVRNALETLKLAAEAAGDIAAALNADAMMSMIGTRH